MDPLRDNDPKKVNDWSLQGRLGSGGTGVVYKAVNGNGLVAAVKVLRPELVDSPLVRERLRREAEVLKRVKGGRTAEVFEVDADYDTPYIAMQLVEGVNLSEFVEKNGPVKGAFAWALVDALVEALRSIHAAGIVHRDLKPSNIIVGPDGVKVVDFGVSVIQDVASSTQTGAMIGTVAWLSPEQITGERATELSDVFNLGMVLAFALIGKHPYGEGRPDAVMFRVAHGEPNLEGLPQKFRNLVESCLIKDPQKRPNLETIELILSAVSKSDSSGEETKGEDKTFVVDRTMVEANARQDINLDDTQVVPDQVVQLAVLKATNKIELKVLAAVIAIVAAIIFFVTQDKQDSGNDSTVTEITVISSTSLESIVPATVESNENPKYKLDDYEGKNIRFDPCEGPIFYAINYGNNTDLDNDSITDAVNMYMKFISKETGFELIFSGATDEVPKEGRNNPRRSSSAILIAFLEAGASGSNFMRDDVDSYSSKGVMGTNDPRWNAIINSAIQISPSKVETSNDLKVSIMVELLQVLGLAYVYENEGAVTSAELLGVGVLGNGLYGLLKDTPEWGPGDILGMKAVGAANGCIG